MYLRDGPGKLACCLESRIYNIIPIHFFILNVYISLEQYSKHRHDFYDFLKKFTL